MADTDGCELWVAEGTNQVAGTPTSSFAIADGLELYGGFAGTEVLRTQRDFRNRPTVLSGVLADLSGTAYHVLTFGERVHALVDGFTVTGGIADNTLASGSDDDHGGGIFSEGYPVLKNCRVEGNASEYDGAGMVAYGGAPFIVNSVFLGNSTANAGYGGGGLAGFDARLILVNTVVAANHSWAHGCGIVNYGNTVLTLIGSTVFLNTCGGDSQILSDDQPPPLETEPISSGAYSDIRYSISWRWGNDKNSTGNIDSIVYSDIGEAGYDGSGSNLSVDPKLDSAYHLVEGSPCIDAIATASGEVPYTDLDGNGRNGPADMGAYEYQGTPSSLDPLCGAPVRWGENGHDYLYCDVVSVPWTAADLYCRSIGAHLADITSLQENAFILSRLGGYNHLWWIGATDAVTEGSWTWRPTNAPLSYTNWDTDEPDDTAYPDSQDCAALREANGKWWTSDCEDTRTSFLCEIE